ncbi:MAG: excisionase, partial [Alphaproteobacteria bacterium HGW-Alphaproteobacteria-2]
MIRRARRGKRLSEKPEYLTTREVADLLRVQQRKVYDLAAAGGIPHRRVTGKLLFPRAEIEAWVEGSSAASAPPPGQRPAVLAGSHDPLLDWAVRESGSGLAVLFDGSMDGLARFERGEAALAGLHIPEASPQGLAWNTTTLAARAPKGAVLIGWARRRQGLILGRALGGIAALGALRGRRVALRQEGAGGGALFAHLAAEAGLGAGAFLPGPCARTESEAAEAVASGEAEAAPGLEAMARRFGLDFLPLADEYFDLLIDRHTYFTPPVQRLLAFARGPALAERAADLGGYDLAPMGSVRWLG